MPNLLQCKRDINFYQHNHGNTFKIIHELNCNDKCLVYILTCNVCLKQYVGQTVKEFKYRWNNYKNNGRKYQEYGTCKQQHLFEHFSEEGQHSCLEDVFTERKLLEKYPEDHDAMETER